MQLTIFSIPAAEPAQLKNTISFEQAQDIYKLTQMAKELDKLRESARYLYGKKRGAWGRMTYADEKRSNKISNLNCSYNNAFNAYCKKYNTDHVIINLLNN